MLVRRQATMIARTSSSNTAAARSSSLAPMMGSTNATCSLTMSLLRRGPGRMSAIGRVALLRGLKVVTRNGWFAARPSGTEAVYKIYAESFKNKQHLQAILEEAQQIVANA